MVELVKEFRDVFAFMYDELKAYRDDVFKDTIPLKLDSKPFRQKDQKNKPQVSSYGQTRVTENVGNMHHCANKAFIMVLELSCS